MLCRRYSCESKVAQLRRTSCKTTRSCLCVSCLTTPRAKNQTGEATGSDGIPEVTTQWRGGSMRILQEFDEIQGYRTMTPRHYTSFCESESDDEERPHAFDSRDECHKEGRRTDEKGSHFSNLCESWPPLHTHTSDSQHVCIADKGKTVQTQARKNRHR